MLDDTCYMLGFDTIDFAVYTLILLNTQITTEFLQSITFSDAKRTFTKDVLMRIDLQKLSSQFSIQELKKEVGLLNKRYSLNAGVTSWKDYLKQITPVQSGQIKIFV